MGSVESDFNISRAFFSKTHAIPFLLRPVPERVNYFNQLKSSLCATIMTKFPYPRNLFSLLGKFLSQSWESHLGLVACLDIWGRALILCVFSHHFLSPERTFLLLYLSPLFNPMAQWGSASKEWRVLQPSSQSSVELCNSFFPSDFVPIKLRYCFKMLGIILLPCPWHFFC